MPTPNAVLAMILAVAAPPGASPHSVVEVAPYETRKETRAEGLERYRTIAKAIAVASRGSAELARVLVTIVEHESSYRRDIHSCQKLGDRGHSFSVFQLRLGKGSREGAAVCGLDYPATLRAARTAARRIGRRNVCGAGPNCVGAFIRYSGLPREVVTSDPRYASKIVARGKTYAATATRRALPRWATIGE